MQRTKDGLFSRAPAQRNLNRAARPDPLTALLTRAQFFERLELAIDHAKASGEIIGLMLLNLDHFKELNARHGRVFADLVLVGTAQRLIDCTRVGDAIARIGADEFAVILQNLTNLDAATLATGRLLTVLAFPHSLENRKVVVTGTVGVALYPDHADSADALLRCADFAISHAREYTRNTCRFYSQELHEKRKDHEAWRARVAKGLASLTPREREVQQMLVAGKSNKAMGSALGTSTRTIENHRASIMNKMAAESLPELVRMVIEVGGSLPVFEQIDDAENPAKD